MGSFEVSNGEYVTVESNHANYLIREDGIAIRTAKDGTVSKEYFPPAGTKYIHAAAGSGASYLILDNGVVERLGESWNMFCPSTKGKKTSELVPPEGAKWKYIKASCGRDATYLLRSDGAVDRTSGGKI